MPGKAQAQQHHKDTAEPILSHREPQPSLSLHPFLPLPSIASQTHKAAKAELESPVQHLGSTRDGDPAKDYFNLQYFWQQNFSQAVPTVFLGYVTLTLVGPDQNYPRAQREKGLFSILMVFQ